MVTPDLKALAERQARHWDEDGLTELVIGALWIFIAGPLLLGTALGPGLIRTAFWIVMPLVDMAGGIYVTIWGIKGIRERVTYPRTGYVNFMTPRSAWAAVVVVILIGLALIVLPFAGIGARLWDLLPAICSLVLAAGFAFLAVRQKTPSFLIFAGPALAAAIGIPLLHIGENAFLWLWLWLGTVSAVTGAFRLRSFLRGHPRSQEREA